MLTMLNTIEEPCWLMLVKPQNADSMGFTRLTMLNQWELRIHRVQPADAVSDSAHAGLVGKMNNFCLVILHTIAYLCIWYKHIYFAYIYIVIYICMYINTLYIYIYIWIHIICIYIYMFILYIFKKYKYIFILYICSYHLNIYIYIFILYIYIYS